MQWWERMASWNGRVKQDLYMQMMCLMANSEKGLKSLWRKLMNA